MQDDAQIIQRIKNGNPSGYRMLIDRYQRMVGAIVFRMVKNEQDREEIAQDVFVKAYRSLHTYRGDAKFSTWIGRIAYNQSLTYLRKKKLPLYDDMLNPGNDEDEENDTGSWDKFGVDDQNPEQTYAQNERKYYLRKAIEELPGEYGTILSLFHLEELSIKEISDMLKMPDGTVKNYLFRARKMLKEKIEKSEFLQKL